MRTVMHRGHPLDVETIDGCDVVTREGQTLGEVHLSPSGRAWHIETTYGARGERPTFRAAVAEIDDLTREIVARDADGWTRAEGREHAAHWQSPGTIGAHLAALASGAPVRLDAVLDDIRRTRADYVRTLGTLAPADDVAELDHLATYALACGAL